MPSLNSRTFFWWLCLFVAPLTLVTIELFHPAHFTQFPGMYEYLSNPEVFKPQYKALDYWGPPWWVTMHMIQTPTVCLFTVGLIWLVAGDHENKLSNVTAWSARVATFVFIVFYTVLDAVGGIGLGRSMLTLQGMQQQLTPDQYAAIVTFLDKNWQDSVVGGVGSFVSLVGSWAAFITAVLVATTLRLRFQAPWPALALMVAGGWVLQMSHASPTGPIAFGLFAGSALWMWLRGIRLR